MLRNFKIARNFRLKLFRKAYLPEQNLNPKLGNFQQGFIVAPFYFLEK